jgi:hypothetical protein
LKFGGLANPCALKHSDFMAKDVNQIAASIVAQTTGEPLPAANGKNPAAVALGRLGGLKGGKARAEALSPRKRKMIAQKAAASRWNKAKH